MVLSIRGGGFGFLRVSRVVEAGRGEGEVPFDMPLLHPSVLAEWNLLDPRFRVYSLDLVYLRLRRRTKGERGTNR